MNKAEIIYHLSVILISIFVFFPKIETDLNPYLEIPLKILLKGVPTYCVAFSCFELISSLL